MIKKEKTELLAPAGNFEKLKIAIYYGADAVYLGGKDFSLRNFSGNFTPDEMQEAISFAHQNHVKVYVACNIYPRNYEDEPIREYLKSLGQIKPDAVILSDPGIITEACELIPEIPIHLSTQANTTNYKSALFWKKLGIQRINVARELSLKEIREIADRTSLEIEAFVHGSMCISYSGRCLLSNFMANRESNRGMCCHPCRFNYAVVEAKRPGEYFPVTEDDRGTYIFNSKDLCMIEHIPAMIESGVNSLKIEGRMKGINYVASAVKIYREAIDDYYANPEDYRVKDYWKDELSKINYRGYCTGFYMGEPDQTVPNYEEGLYHAGTHIFAGKVISTIKSSEILETSEFFQAVVDVRNKIFKDDTIEILTRKGQPQQTHIIDIIDDKGESLPFAQPNSIVTIIIDKDCTPNDLIRKRT